MADIIGAVLAGIIALAVVTALIAGIAWAISSTQPHVDYHVKIDGRQYECRKYDNNDVNCVRGRYGG